MLVPVTGDAVALAAVATVGAWLTVTRTWTALVVLAPLGSVIVTPKPYRPGCANVAVVFFAELLLLRLKVGSVAPEGLLTMDHV